MKKIITSLAILIIGLFIATSVQAIDSTVTVTGNTSPGENQPGWMFGRDLSNATPFSFVMSSPSIGVGSLYVEPLSSVAAKKFIGENFINTPITEINSISYDFKIGAGGSSTQEEQFYMNVYANFGISDDLKFYDCRYDVVPTVGSKDGYTTVTFDPNNSYPVTTRGGASASPFTCPSSPAAMDTLSAGSNIRAFALNLGDTSANDVGLDGYFDNVVVDLGSGVTTYDFEPMLKPANKSECKKDGWMSFNSPIFKNQGDCVSFLQSSDRASANKLK